jgi:hypothetical protein
MPILQYQSQERRAQTASREGGKPSRRPTGETRAQPTAKNTLAPTAKETLGSRDPRFSRTTLSGLEPSDDNPMVG